MVGRPHFLHQMVASRQYQCCMCMHVRTGTVLLGVWQILVHFLVAGILIALVFRPDLVPSAELESSMNVIAMGQKETIVFNDHPLSKPVPNAAGSNAPGAQSPSAPASEDEEENNLHTAGADHGTVRNRVRGAADEHMKHRDRCWGLALTLLSLLFSIMLFHGALWGRPAFLIPYFCLQVFDFAIACLSLVGYLSYMPDIKLWIEEKDNFPYKHELLGFDRATLAFVVMAVSCFLLTLKAYLLGMVWACYRYLLAVQQVASIDGSGAPVGAAWLLGNSGGQIRMLRRRQTGLRGEAMQTSAGGTDLERGAESQREPLLLPPLYEEIIKLPADNFMPPPYSTNTAPVPDAVEASHNPVPTTTNTTVAMGTNQDAQEIGALKTPSCLAQEERESRPPK